LLRGGFDLTRHPDKTSESALLEALRADFHITVGSSPSIRATVVLLGKENRRLLANLDRLVADGWSVGLVISELPQFYAELARNGSHGWIGRLWGGTDCWRSPHHESSN